MSDTIPAWAADYIGLPFREHGRDRNGTDCWGLVILIAAERFSLRLPSYVAGYASTRDADDIGRLVRGQMDLWREVPRGHEQPGDVVLMRLMNQPMHVGVVVARAWMLHIEEGIDACLERYDGAKWRRRVIGIFRWREAVSRQLSAVSETELSIVDHGQELAEG
jgi:cell wall-associated NlpC family hydrolase